MSIATVTIFTVMIMNPTGTSSWFGGEKPAPYLLPAAQVAAEYKTPEACATALTAAREAMASKADQVFRSNVLNKDVEYRAQQKRYESLKCVKSEKKIDTETEVEIVEAPKAAPTPSPVPPKATRMQPQAVVSTDDSDMVAVYRIGRVDEANTFFGTAYNTNVFLSAGECNRAYKKTEGVVLSKAMAERADSDAALEVLAKFKDLYSCTQVQMSVNDVRQAPTRIVEEKNAQPQTQQAQGPVAQPAYQGQAPMAQQPQVYMPANAPVQGYAPQPILKPQQLYPVKPSFIMVQTRAWNGEYVKSMYPTPYPSISQCNQAIAVMFSSYNDDDQRRISCVY